MIPEDMGAGAGASSYRCSLLPLRHFAGEYGFSFGRVSRLEEMCVVQHAEIKCTKHDAPDSQLRLQLPRRSL